MVGNVGVGGANPIRVQSMLTCDTMDTDGVRPADARPGRRRLRDRPHHRAHGQGRGQSPEHRRAACATQGCDVPIVADIHFKPDAAMEAARGSRKSAINPGNYADTKKFKILEYTDEQYARGARAASTSASRRWSSSARSAASPCASAPTTARSPTAS